MGPASTDRDQHITTKICLDRLCKAGVRGSSPLVSTHQPPRIPSRVPAPDLCARSTRTPWAAGIVVQTDVQTDVQTRALSRRWARSAGRRCYSATLSTLGGLRGSAGCRSGARAPALGTVGRRRRVPLAQVAPWLRRAYCRSCHEGSHEKSVAGVVAFGVEVGGRDPVIDGR
jgi:hypothetical protein